MREITQKEIKAARDVNKTARFRRVEDCGSRHVRETFFFCFFLGVGEDFGEIDFQWKRGLNGKYE
jgi:hypothetical protein